jgi:hypothetical protein
MRYLIARLFEEMCIQRLLPQYPDPGTYELAFQLLSDRLV